MRSREISSRFEQIFYKSKATSFYLFKQTIPQIQHHHHHYCKLKNHKGKTPQFSKKERKKKKKLNNAKHKHQIHKHTP